MMESFDGAPMTLGNLRSLGMRSLQVYCNNCPHHGVLDINGQPDHLAVKSFEPKMYCTKCGSKNVDVRPNWSEYAPTKNVMPTFPPGGPVKQD